MGETKAGRPRSESTRAAILQAAADLVAELGYAKVTMGAIATRAGAGKQTVYRWWTSKANVVADAVVAGYLRLPAPALAETDSLGSDLKAWLSATVEVANASTTAPVVRALAAAASEDSDQATALWQHLTGPLHEALLGRLTRGQRDGQLAADVDAAAIADALLGIVLFRLVAHQPSPSRLDGVVDALLGSAPLERG